jgi:hypothetical protein
MRRKVVQIVSPTIVVLECGHTWTYCRESSRNLKRGTHRDCEDCRLLDVLGGAEPPSADERDEG